MVLTLSTQEAPTRLGDIIAAVQDPTQSVMLTEDGRPVAAVVSIEDYERLRKNRVDRAWASIDRMRERNAHLGPDEVLRDVTEIVEDVRQEMYDEEQRAAAHRR